MRELGSGRFNSEEDLRLEVERIHSYNEGLDDAALFCELKAQELLDNVSNESLAVAVTNVIKEIASNIRELN